MNSLLVGVGISDRAAPGDDPVADAVTAEAAGYDAVSDQPPRSRSEADGGQDPLSALEPVSTTVAVLTVGSLSRSLLGEARRRA
jgi:hypothetical protein